MIYASSFLDASTLLFLISIFCFIRKWHVQATCATNGEGLYEAMDILATYTKEFKKQRNYGY